MSSFAADILSTHPVTLSKTTQEQNTPSTSCSQPSTLQAAETFPLSSSFRSCDQKRRIRFSDAWDIPLLKTGTAVDAHLAPNGEAQTRLEEALVLFKGSLSAACLQPVTEPTWKTLNDRYKRIKHILSDHRDAVKKNAIASGIIEVRGERETLLDDVMPPVDEWEEACRAERDERTELDKRLVAARQEIRARALSRSRSNTVSDNGPDGDVSSPPKKKPQKRTFPSDSESESDDEDREFMAAHIKARQDIDDKRLKIEEQRLQFEISREERDSLRLIKAQEIDTRRIAVNEKRVELEQRRLELDGEERKGAIAERKELLHVLGALVRKLQ